MPLRDIIRHNFWWKAAAMFFACLIWATVRYGDPAMGSDDAVRRLDDVPVHIVVRPGEAASWMVEPGTVTVTVRGTHADVHALKTSEITAFVPTGDSPLRRVEVTVPPGIRTISVTPFEVRIERRTTQSGSPDR